MENSEGPVYTTTTSGFRYRSLAARPEDGYEAAIGELHTGEFLYRMMDGPHRVAGKLFPILINGENDFGYCVRKREWTFVLAAGIPVTSPSGHNADAKLLNAEN